MAGQERLSALNTDITHTRTFNTRYSAFIKASRYLLPALIIFLTVIVISWSVLDEDVAMIPQEDFLDEIKEEALVQTALIKPRFETIDENNQPVFIEAQKATQNKTDPALVLLDSPAAMLKTAKGETITLDALQGTFDQKKNRLFLQNDIHVTHEDGYLLKAKELRIDMINKQAFSDKNIVIESANEHLEATGLDGDLEKGVLIFKGPAKLTIRNKGNIL